MAANENLLKARLPRGLSDRTAGEIRTTERLLSAIRRVYERYGFEPLETPMIEYTEALGKFLPDQDRPNAGVFSLQDDDEQWLSLRYDLTAPLARFVAENYERLPKPYRSYRFGWVFRNEKPGPGRFRQFMQFDADTVGSASPAADAEMCMMAADTLEALGIPRGQYVIKVNSRKILDGVMEMVGLSGEAHAGRRLTVLRAIDKYDRLGIDAVRALLGSGREDESGDFTKGAGLDESQVEMITNILGFGSDGDVTKTSLAQTDAGRSGTEELAAIDALVRASDYGDDRIRVDPSVVRGLEYYTGAVIEAELKAEIANEKGQPVVFGSIGGGGRYDGLVGRFMPQDAPATGFSIGVSRLQAALAALGRSDAADTVGPVVVTVMDRDRVADYQGIVARLRAAGIAAELYLGGSGMKAQLKYADRRNAAAVVIQGGDEQARGVVQIKDLAVGKRLSATVADHEQWRQERPGQFEVSLNDIVDRLRRMLSAEQS